MSNEELIQYVKEAKNGNAEAFEKIYTATYREAYIIAYSLVDDKNSIEDIVHDVYIKVLLNIPNLQNEASFKSWFKRIVTNTSKDFIIKKKPDLFSSYEYDGGFDEDFDQRLVDNQSLERPITSKAETDEISKRILSAIEKLPKEQRICVIMHYYSEMKVDEIAKELGVSRNTVLSRLSYARKKLKKELDDDNKNDFFGIAMFPYIQSIETAPEAMAIEANGELLAEIMATAVAQALFAVSGVGIAAKIAGLTLLQKIVLVVFAAAIIGGVAAVAAGVVQNRINDVAATTSTQQAEVSSQADADKTVNENKNEAVKFSGGNLLLHLDGYMYFSDGGGVYRTKSGVAERERIVDGSANNFVTNGKSIYFIAGGLICKYDAEKNKIVKSKNTDSDYVAYNGEDLYTLSIRNREIGKVTPSLDEESVKSINGNHINYLNNSFTYYNQSDMYYISFSGGNLSEQKVIDGSSLKGMKLNSQITDGKVYHPDFDSDETGRINVKSTGGAALGTVTLKRGYVDFCICKDRILYSATDGGLYTSDLNGENETYISNGEYSLTSFSKPYALCYNSKSSTSVLLNVENGKFQTLSSGYVKDFEYDSGIVFYKLNGENHIKTL
ncbi:MAG: RNA polymerase sigma factor [Eubacterium sp.]|nr:RNA polymerase sigma factor [Eubacterium sp.]